MADKVKLTPPMTDSKTPECAREAAQAFHDKWETGMSGAASPTSPKPFSLPTSVEGKRG